MKFRNVKDNIRRVPATGIILSLFIITACGGGGGGHGRSYDSTPPSIKSTYPLEGADTVAKNSVISITFSKALDIATVDTTTVLVSDGTNDIDGTVTLSDDKKTVIFTPSASLANSTTYIVTLKSTIEDLNGKELGEDKAFQFTTGTSTDSVAPAVTVAPVNAAGNVSVSNDITLTFNEAMNPLNINNSTIKLFKGAAEVAVTVTYNTGTFEAEIDRASDLDYDAEYTVYVYAGATDAANNSITAVTSVFTTIQDSTAPSVTLCDPLFSATSVVRDKSIVLTFNKRLAAATVTSSTVYVMKKTDSTVVAGSLVYDDAAKTVTFDPSTDLETGPTEYTVRATSGITDRAGRAMKSNFSYTFTTADGVNPTVSSFSPVDGTTGHSVKTGFSVTFSEAIDTDTLTVDNIKLVDSTDTETDYTYSYNATTKVLTITPTYNLNYKTVYRIIVGTGIKDSAGNSMLSAMQTSFTTKDRHWTIMYYGDADSDLESYILNDVAEMESGYVDDQGIDLILIVDRTPGYSGNSIILNSNFEDTRMFRISNGKAERISGGANFSSITTSSTYEANMGDAATLHKFIKSCKAQYPADRYALILSNHGGGAKSLKYSSESIATGGTRSATKDICYDLTNGQDYLNTAEITDVLTASESVDLFGLDTCFMSSVEFAYQFRTTNGDFNAGIMVASAPVETGYGWNYTDILKRFKSGTNNGTVDETLGGYELYYTPSTLTAAQFGAVIVEEQRDSTASDSSQSLTCLDLSKVAAVKTAVDYLAVALSAGGEKTDLENLRGNAPAASLLHYFDASDDYDWLVTPYFDLYNLSDAIGSSSNFSSEIQGYASTVKTAVDAFVLYSFANSYFSGFTADKSGVHIFFPDGDYTATINGSGSLCWDYQWWYNSLGLSSYGEYGKIAWCIDNQNTAVNTVGNWFELLDSWFDGNNTATGGANAYQW